MKESKRFKASAESPNSVVKILPNGKGLKTRNMYVHTLCGRGKIIARIVTFLRITHILTSRIKISFVNKPSSLKFCEKFCFKEKFNSVHSHCTVTVSQGCFQPKQFSYQDVFLERKNPKFGRRRNIKRLSKNYSRECR